MPIPANLRAQWIEHTQVLLNSYRARVGAELVQRSGDPAEEAERLYSAPFAVLSHGSETDPILNYGNAAALELWAVSPEAWLSMPSRLTAEPVNREARAKFLEQSKLKGFVTGYSGVRIARDGRRFKIEDATIWTVSDGVGEPAGQAATFAHWQHLD